MRRFAQETPPKAPEEIAEEAIESKPSSIKEPYPLTSVEFAEPIADIKQEPSSGKFVEPERFISPSMLHVPEEKGDPSSPQWQGTSVSPDELFQLKLDDLFKDLPNPWELSNFYNTYSAIDRYKALYLTRLFQEVQLGGVDEHSAMRLIMDTLSDELDSIPGVVDYLIENIKTFDFYYIISFIRSLGTVKGRLTESQVRRLFELFNIAASQKSDTTSITNGINYLFKLDLSADKHLIKEFLIPFIGSSTDLVYNFLYQVFSYLSEDIQPFAFEAIKDHVLKSEDPDAIYSFFRCCSYLDGEDFKLAPEIARQLTERIVSIMDYSSGTDHYRMTEPLIGYGADVSVIINWLVSGIAPSRLHLLSELIILFKEYTTQLSSIGISYKYIADLILENLLDSSHLGMDLLLTFVRSCPDKETSKFLIEGATDYILKQDISDHEEKMITLLNPIINSKEIDRILEKMVKDGGGDFLRQQFYWEKVPADKLVNIALNSTKKDIIITCAVKGTTYEKINKEQVRKLTEKLIILKPSADNLVEFAQYVENPPMDILFGAVDKIVDKVGKEKYHDPGIGDTAEEYAKYLTKETFERNRTTEINRLIKFFKNFGDEKTDTTKLNNIIIKKRERSLLLDALSFNYIFKIKTKDIIDILNSSFLNSSSLMPYYNRDLLDKDMGILLGNEVLNKRAKVEQVRFELRQKFDNPDGYEAFRKLYWENITNPLLQSLCMVALKNKDYFLISYIVGNAWHGVTKFEKLLDSYMAIRGKTIEQIYHEAIKANPTFLNSCLLNALSNFSNNEDNLDETGELSELITHAIKISQNTGQFFKFIERFIEICKIYHNNHLLDKQALLNVFINTSIDVSQNYVKDFLNIYSFLAAKANRIHYDINKILSLNPNLVNRNKLDRNLDKFDELSDNFRMGAGKITITKDMLGILKYLASTIDMINNFDMMSKFVYHAKPKNPHLYKLDLNIGNYEFSVLKYLDPEAFSVGIETECCQRKGGAAESSMADSFINPVASVLVLRYGGMLLCQSWFHYVPEDNGYILDNIELNDKGLEKLKLGNKTIGSNKNAELAKLYAIWAFNIKKRYPDISYVKLGLGYTEIDTGLFKKQSEEGEDKRHFEADERLYSYVYTDFDMKNHVDLLQPEAEIAGVDIVAKK